MRWTRAALGVLGASPMPSDFQQLRDRTKRFAFDVIHLVKLLPRNIATDVISRQLMRAATSVEPRYHEAFELRAIFVQSLQTARRRAPATRAPEFLSS
jgi:hypothetical protein